MDFNIRKPSPDTNYPSTRWQCRPQARMISRWWAHETVDAAHVSPLSLMGDTVSGSRDSLCLGLAVDASRSVLCLGLSFIFSLQFTLSHTLSFFEVYMVTKIYDWKWKMYLLAVLYIFFIISDKFGFMAGTNFKTLVQLSICLVFSYYTVKIL